jgi:hypothetical protein
MPTPNRVQPSRSNVTGQRAVTGRLPGELYTNWADRQIGVVSPTAAAMDLVAARYFSTTANYAIGDHVVQGGLMYRAIAAVTAGAFNPAQWTQLATAADITAVVSGNFLPITGGQLTGALGVATTIPAGAEGDSVFAGITTTGNLAFNAYVAGGVWRAKVTGASAIIAEDISGANLNFYSNASAAANAPTTNNWVASMSSAGRLTSAGDVWANGNLVARGNTYLSYNNASDYVAEASTTDRIFQWANNWYDYWHNADGSRHWVYGAVGDLMNLDGSGNFWARGQVYANGNLISNGSIWCTYDISTGSGRTLTAGYVHSTGTVQADLDVNASRNLNVSGTATVGNFSSNLDVSAARNLGVSGSAWITGNLTVSGTFSVGTFSIANLAVTNYITFPNYYGHALAWGWTYGGSAASINGMRLKIDGSDQGWDTYSDNILWWSNNSYGTCAGRSTMGVFAWNVYGALSMEEATAKADAAQADIEYIKTLRAQVEMLTERVRLLEERLA